MTKIFKTYWQLILIFSILILQTSAIVVFFGANDFSVLIMRWMQVFMGSFFILFSLFKILNLTGFVGIFQRYDPIAGLIPVYGYIYPFIELVLGLGYLSGLFLNYVMMLTIIVLGISTLGIYKQIKTGETITCACLGGIIDLPLTKVSLTENLLMILMALVMGIIKIFAWIF